MFSLRNQSGRMAFLLQLCAGTIGRSDVEAIAIQESTPYKRARPVQVAGVKYESITEAASFRLMYARADGLVKKSMSDLERHRAINRFHKEIVRSIEAGHAGYRYL